jgi:hypothetical protein
MEELDKEGSRWLLTQWLLFPGVALSFAWKLPIEAHVFRIFQHVTAMKFPWSLLFRIRKVKNCKF